jgi:hypothetical protein
MPSYQVHPPGVLTFLRVGQPTNDRLRTLNPQFLTDPPSVEAIEGIVLLINVYRILDPIGVDIGFQCGLFFQG